MEFSPSSLISHFFISNLFSLVCLHPCCLIYQQLGVLRVQSNAAVGRQESHESGDWLAMEGQDRETAGKRKTKNSTSLAEGEKELAKAKKESERQAKREQKLKEKEKEDLEHALLVSSWETRGTLLIDEQEAHRKEEAAHLDNAHASSSIEPTPLHLLGSVASSSNATFARISQGKEEADPNDQVLDPNDFSPFSSFSEDQKPESSDSLMITEDNDVSLFVVTSSEATNNLVEGPSQQQISSEISVVEDLNDLNEEKKVETREDRASSVSSGGSYQYPNSVDLGSHSSTKLSSRSGGSERSGSSNNSCRTFTKGMYEQLMASSDKWECAADVILELRNLSLGETKVSIHSEVIAGIVYDSRPATCDVSQLIKAQSRNFEKAHKELASDLAKIKKEETRKIQHARRILEKKMAECDGKSREPDSRIKATAIFGDGHESLAALEQALEESLEDNRSLRDRVKVLEATLKDMLNSGITHSSLKGKGIVTRIKT